MAESRWDSETRAEVRAPNESETPWINLFLIRRVSMQFEDQPVYLGTDADDHFAEDVDHVSAVGVNRPGAVRTRRQEKVLVLGVRQQPDREAIGRDGGHATHRDDIANR